MNEDLGLKPELLIELLTYRMPFGKYDGTRLRDLPVSYIEWFARKGFPQGKLGMLMSTIHIIKTNDLDSLLEQLDRKLNKSTTP